MLFRSIREFIPYSPVNDTLTFWLVAGQLLFFGSAIITYMVHGALKDTNNQLKQPHVLGKRHLPTMLIRVYMWFLVLAELGGFAVLLAGLVMTLWSV